MQDQISNHSEFPKDNPFDVPKGYFEMLDSRIEARIDAEMLTGKQKFIRLMKPAMGLAASFLLAFLLIYYPGKELLSSWQAKNNKATDEELIQNMASHIDDNILYQTLTAHDDPETFETNEILSLLSTELNDYDVYAEIMVDKQ